MSGISCSNVKMGWRARIIFSCEIPGCQKLGSIFIEMGKDRIESSGENKRISRTAWERWTGIRMRQGKSLCVWVLARTKLIRRKKKTNKHTLLRRFFSSSLFEIAFVRVMLLRTRCGLFFFFDVISSLLFFSLNFPPTNSLFRALRRRIYRFHFVSHMSDFSAAHIESTWSGGYATWSAFSMTTSLLTKHRFNGLYFHRFASATRRSVSLKCAAISFAFADKMRQHRPNIFSRANPFSVLSNFH